MIRYINYVLVNNENYVENIIFEKLEKNILGDILCITKYY